jgi:hypothetical protein
LLALVVVKLIEVLVFVEFNELPEAVVKLNVEDVNELFTDDDVEAIIKNE